MNICALHVICIWGYIDFLAKTADSYEQFLIAIIGPGGSGKTFMENQVIRPAIRHFFGDAADKAVAPNNAAAKCLGQATTMHLACKKRRPAARPHAMSRRCWRERILFDLMTWASLKKCSPVHASCWVE